MKCNWEVIYSLVVIRQFPCSITCYTPITVILISIKSIYLVLRTTACIVSKATESNFITGHKSTIG